MTAVRPFSWDDRPVGDHEEHHVAHEGQGGLINGVLQGELLPLCLGILDPAAGDAHQGHHRDGKDRQERGLAVQVVLHLDAHIGAHRHADGDGEGKAADALGDLGGGEHVPGQGHGGRAADGVHRPHIQADDHQSPKYGKDQKGRKGQAEQSQEEQIDPVAVKIVQQIARHRPEEDGGQGHGGEDDAHPGAGDADFLTVDGDDGDGSVKGCQDQEIGQKEEHKFRVPLQTRPPCTGKLVAIATIMIARGGGPVNS